MVALLEGHSAYKALQQDEMKRLFDEFMAKLIEKKKSKKSSKSGSSKKSKKSSKSSKRKRGSDSGDEHGAVSDDSDDDGAVFWAPLAGHLFPGCIAPLFQRYRLTFARFRHVSSASRLTFGSFLVDSGAGKRQKAEDVEEGELPEDPVVLEARRQTILAQLATSSGGAR